MAWSDMLFKDGFKAFYPSDAMTDYPPGYMYVLFIVGFIRNALSLEYNSYAFTVLIKLPAIIADVCAGIFLYRITLGHLKEDGKMGLAPLTAASLYVFNPLVIMISSVWGQVDGVHTLIIAISLYLLIKRKELGSYLLFALAIIIKPQSLMFGPVYLFYAFLTLKEKGFKPRAFLELLVYVLSCAGLWLILLSPFITWPLVSWGPEGINLTPVLRQFADTLSSYPYYSVNAYNIYALLGFNWKPLTDTFTVMNQGINIFTYLSLTTAVAGCLLLLARNASRWSAYLAAAATCAYVFMFSVMMHERYFFPVLLLLIAAYVYSGNRRIIYAYGLISLAGLTNCADALNLAVKDYDYSLIDITSRVLPVVWVAAFGFLVYVLITAYRRKHAEFKDFDEGFKWPEAAPRQVYSRWGLGDLLRLAPLVIVYAAIAFFRLGDMDAPESAWSPGAGGEAVFDLGSPVNGQTLWFYNGVTNEREFHIGYSTDGLIYDYDYAFTEDGSQTADILRRDTDAVFRWHSLVLNRPWDYRYVKITSGAYDLMIMEMAFKDAWGNVVPASVSYGAEALTDEAGLVPEAASYMNGTYFDEVYHPRTAYEFIHGLPVYETSHPPLGKVLIAAGIKIFGMNPFGWRFMGTLAGVLMIPLFYAFAKRLFRSENIAFFAAFIFTFDFMHLVQTRLATIDSFLTLFVIAEYYCMYRYIQMSGDGGDERWNKRLSDRANAVRPYLWLFLSGLCMGLGAAVKWSGVYAGIGLGVIFAVSLYRRWKQGEPDFIRKILPTLGACVVFFIIIPALVYAASYIPYYFHCHSLSYTGDSLKGFISGIMDNQSLMLHYHGESVLDSTHPYSSDWWSWPVSLVPIWYYSAQIGGLTAGISAFGNPAVWWGGLIALGICAYRFIKTGDKRLAFLILAYCAQLLPWAFVSRIVFIYHYFPSVPFLALLIACVFEKIRWRWALAMMIVTGLLFAVFYPVLTGIPVDAGIARAALRWLPRWVLL
jgi:Gpi18-like mannosyltransferase